MRYNNCVNIHGCYSHTNLFLNTYLLIHTHKVIKIDKEIIFKWIIV